MKLDAAALPITITIQNKVEIFQLGTTHQHASAENEESRQLDRFWAQDYYFENDTICQRGHEGQQCD
jgi:hypothetical protein